MLGKILYLLGLIEKDGPITFVKDGGLSQLPIYVDETN